MYSLDLRIRDGRRQLHDTASPTLPQAAGLMAIRDWPPARATAREAAGRRRRSALSDAELLAVLFGSGCRGNSAVDLGAAAAPRTSAHCAAC